MEDVAGVARAPQEGWVMWDVAGKPVSVRLSRDVVGRLSMAVREGFQALPRRGLETGGLLIGKTGQAGSQILVEVTDFEPVECEHATGPSYLLSDTDRRVLEVRIAAHATAGADHSIIGFYRSHTRPDYSITAEDVAIFSAYFPKASDVFLLIKSNDGAPPTGGFIIREGSRVLSGTPYAQFPFYTFITTPADREPFVSAVQTAQAPMPATRIVPSSAVQPVRRSRRRPSRLAIAIAAALMLGVLLGIEVGMPGTTVADPGPPLGLHVTNNGDGLRLSWNHLASQRAGGALLWIRDGSEEKKYALDAKQLGEGSVAYWPSNADVNFRLELIAPGPPVNESVRAIGGPSKRPSPEFPADSPPPAPEAAKAAPPARTPAKRSRTFALPPPRRSLPAAVTASLPEPPAIQQVAALPPEHARELPKPAPQVSATSPVGRSDPAFHVVAEPVTGSRLEHLASNIPLIGKRYRHSDYVPPVPLRHPVLPNPPTRDLAQEVNIDVKVYINTAGKVDFSEVVSKVPEKLRGLAQFAVFSGRRWEFAPARSGNSPVQGAMILHYQFLPGAQPVVNRTVAAR